MRNNKNASSCQRRLRFEIEEVWSLLPEAVKQDCRNLCRELLASVLPKGERRQNERED